MEKTLKKILLTVMALAVLSTGAAFAQQPDASPRPSQAQNGGPAQAGTPDNPGQQGKKKHKKHARKHAQQNNDAGSQGPRQ
jgi:hypothetical protein